MVSASVYLDLSTEPGIFDNSDRKVLEDLQRVPDGARVVVWVGDRDWVSIDTTRWLHPHAERLLIEFRGTPRANLRRWVNVARTGSAELEAVIE